MNKHNEDKILDEHFETWWKEECEEEIIISEYKLHHFKSSYSYLKSLFKISWMNGAYTQKNKVLNNE